MTHDELRLMRDCVDALLLHDLRVEAPLVDRADVRRRREAARKVPDAVAEGVGDDVMATWSGELGREMLRRCRPGPRGPDGVSFGPDGHVVLHQLAALRVAHAVATGRTGSLSVDERRVAASYAERRKREGDLFGSVDFPKLIGLLGHGAPDPWYPPRLPGVPPACAFAFAWPRPVGAQTSPTRSAGLAPMREVAASDAPVACRLATTTRRSLDVRTHAGTFLRPVLSPGGWEPIGVDAFVAAAAEGRRWADNPFVPQSRHMPVLALAEMAAPAKVRPAVAEEAAARVVARVGTLVVVDGIVHRECPPPVACLVRTSDGPISVSWAIPGQVEATDDQLFLRVGQVGIRRPSLDGGDPWVPFAEHHPAMTVPLAEADALTRMAAECLADEDGPTLSTARTFEVLTPDAWRRDPARRFEAALGIVAATPDRRDDGVRTAALTEALRAAARAASRGEDPDVGRVLMALDGDTGNLPLMVVRHLAGAAQGPDAVPDEDMSGLSL